MDQFRTASENQAVMTTHVPAVTDEGARNRPTGVPAAQAQGPVTHMPILRFDPVHQGWTDSKCR